MSGMGEPDQIDMMTEHELRIELRGVLVDLARMAEDATALQSRLEQLQSQREVDASLDAKLTDNVRGHWERRIKELESRLQGALNALQAYLDAGTWDAIHDAHNGARAILSAGVERGSTSSCGAMFPPGQFAVQQCTLPKGHAGEHANNVKGL